MIRFVFVGGCERSGTTLIQKILVSHTKIVGGPEFDHTYAILNLYKKMISPYRLERQAFFYTKDTLTAKFRLFYESLFEEAFLRKKNAVYLSEKTPINIEIADGLLETFSDALFVNVIRDGRDVLVSHRDIENRYKEKHGINRRQFSVPKICRRWNSRINAYFKMQNNPHLSKRLFTVKFEDLITDSKTELTKLFKFLGLELEKKLLHLDKLSKFDAHMSAIPYSNVYRPEETQGKNYDAGRINRWKKNLGWWDKVLANLLMGDNLNRLKYEINPVYLKCGEFMQITKYTSKELMRR